MLLEISYIRSGQERSNNLGVNNYIRIRISYRREKERIIRIDKLDCVGHCYYYYLGILV